MKKMIRKGQKGFTLIELMIVVAIIGILAAIAIPNFLRFQLKSKTSEGKVNLAAIRTAEESYLAEFGRYVAAAVTPTGTVGPQKLAWPPPTVTTPFDTVGWQPEGDVFFQYAVGIGGAGGSSAFFATAEADIDGNGTSQFWGYDKPDGADASAAPNGHVCGNLASKEQVGPCDSPVAGGAGVFGQSEF